LGCFPDTEFQAKGFIQKLSPVKLATRIRYLNDISFVWDVQDTQWYDMYQRLACDDDNDDDDNDNKINYDSSISVLSNTDTNNNNTVNNQNNELSVWMLEQRRLKKYNELSTKRVELLNDIDFVWEPQTTNWLTMYDKLCLYATQKQQQQAANDMYDDDNDNLSGDDGGGGGVGQWNYAPSRSPTSSDPDLGLWCHSQRRSYKRKTLSKERIQYLNSIDFVWEV